MNIVKIAMNVCEDELNLSFFDALTQTTKDFKGHEHLEASMSYIPAKGFENLLARAKKATTEQVCGCLPG